MAVVIEDMQVSEEPPAPAAHEAPSASAPPASPEIDEHRLAAQLARQQWSVQRLHAD